jgi:LuxR family transcriptional activator of bioluminescence operon
MLKNFAADMINTETTKQAEALLTHYLQHAGFRHFAFTYYSMHVKSGRKLRYDFVSSPLKPWHQHYLEQGYADVDRTLEENFQITLPLLWDVHEQKCTAKNKRETRIRDESVEYGIHRGLSLPVHGPDRDFAVLTLHQCEGERSLKKYQDHQYEWLAAAQIYYHHIRRLLDLGNKIQNAHALTPREIQCLNYTAKSWRVEQIAKALKISVRTVNFHLQNANRKLGTNNKYQSVFHYFSSGK